jgi:hypothetical protein
MQAGLLTVTLLRKTIDLKVDTMYSPDEDFNIIDYKKG